MFGEIDTYFNDSSCTKPISLDFTAYGDSYLCSPTPNCAEYAEGGYFTTDCYSTLDDSFSNAATDLFNATTFLYFNYFDSSDCSGDPSGYEADLIDTCIPLNSTYNTYSSYKYHIPNASYYFNAECLGEPNASILIPYDCIAANVGSWKLVSDDGSGTTGPNISIILGGVFGGVAFLTIIGVWIWWRRRRQISVANEQLPKRPPLERVLETPRTTIPPNEVSHKTIPYSSTMPIEIPPVSRFRTPDVVPLSFYFYAYFHFAWMMIELIPL
ncbi:hypothetical protein HDU84_006633 [Entophlyctis sp. JEL0112]|nr:hypothetical protein HDU84_006633 [Entophlyctis sp. JEL0112]